MAPAGAASVNGRRMMLPRTVTWSVLLMKTAPALAPRIVLPVTTAVWKAQPRDSSVWSSDQPAPMMMAALPVPQASRKGVSRNTLSRTTMSWQVGPSNHQASQVKARPPLMRSKRLCSNRPCRNPCAMTRTPLSWKKQLRTVKRSGRLAAAFSM